MHNVLIVLFFSCFQHDGLSKVQCAGFAVSICGSLCYAGARMWAAQESSMASSDLAMSMDDKVSDDPEDSTEVPNENFNS